MLWHQSQYCWWFKQGSILARGGRLWEVDKRNSLSQLETKERLAKGLIVLSWLTPQCVTHTEVSFRIFLFFFKFTFQFVFCTLFMLVWLPCLHYSLFMCSSHFLFACFKCIYFLTFHRGWAWICIIMEMERIRKKKFSCSPLVLLWQMHQSHQQTQQFEQECNFLPQSQQLWVQDVINQSVRAFMILCLSSYPKI